MVQALTYAKTGKLISKADLRNHPTTRYFDQVYAEEALKLRLKQLGVRDTWMENLIDQATDSSADRKALKRVATLDRILDQFERRCSSKATFRVTDGEMREAIYCVRSWAKNYPRTLLKNPTFDASSAQRAFECMHLESTPKKDRTLSRTLARSIERLTQEYNEMVDFLATRYRRSRRQVLLELAMRSQTASPDFRITGDAAIEATQAVIRNRSRRSIQDALQALLDPEHAERASMTKVLRIVADYRHGV